MTAPPVGATVVSPLQASRELLERVADALVSGRIVAPPLTRIALEETPAVLSQAHTGHAEGKTVITF
jgi:NADPH:quinone reductase-like Zn-dependent oxidoreductase